MLNLKNNTINKLVIEIKGNGDDWLFLTFHSPHFNKGQIKISCIQNIVNIVFGCGKNFFIGTLYTFLSTIYKHNSLYNKH